MILKNMKTIEEVIRNKSRLIACREILVLQVNY